MESHTELKIAQQPETQGSRDIFGGIHPPDQEVAPVTTGQEIVGIIEIPGPTRFHNIVEVLNTQYYFMFSAEGDLCIAAVFGVLILETITPVPAKFEFPG